MSVHTRCVLGGHVSSSGSGSGLRGDILITVNRPAAFTRKRTGGSSGFFGCARGVRRGLSSAESNPLCASFVAPRFPVPRRVGPRPAPRFMLLFNELYQLCVGHTVPGYGVVLNNFLERARRGPDHGLPCVGSRLVPPRRPRATYTPCPFSLLRHQASTQTTPS